MRSEPNKLSKPPRLAQWILSRVADRSVRYSALGDFAEQFHLEAQEDGLLTARLAYWWQVVRSLPAFVQDSLYWSMVMIKNYLKIAFRNIRRHKVYSAINLSGLAIGIACCLFIALYVLDELSYDRYHEKVEQIYRLVPDLETPTGPRHLAQSAPPIAPLLKSDYAEVVDAVRFVRGSGIYRYQDRQFLENQIYYADASIFNVFTFQLVDGDPATALQEPYAVVLSEEVARKYFGDADPINQTLLEDNGDAYRVTGVMKKIPRNSHFTFEIVMSFSTLEQANPSFAESWGAFFVPTYLLLESGFNAAVLQAKLPDFVARRRGPESGLVLHLQPLSDIYLRSHRRGEHGPRGSLSLLYILSAVALFVLILACVNFMNLATARSLSRAKEVGLRKVVGARRNQVARQFIGEAILLSFVAAFLAIALCQLLLPLFNQLSGKPLNLSAVNEGAYWLALLGFGTVVGLAAGIYPALVLSGFKPTAVIQGAFKSTMHGQALRKGLVVFQFAVSVVLIVGTAVVQKQLNFVRNENLGFDKEKLLAIDFRRDQQVIAKPEVIKQAFLDHSDVISASASSSMPGRSVPYTSISVFSEGDTLQAFFGMYQTDFDFIDNYGFEMVAGRAFSRSFATDSSEAVIVNEAAVTHFGWESPEEALGRRFWDGERERKIIAVVRNFNYKSLHERVEPLFLTIAQEGARYFSIRLDTKRLTQAVSDLERIWNGLVPQRPFDFFFLDQQLDQQYRADEQFGQVFGTFTGLAIFIACIGLFGLAAFTTEQRTKEIGIRKVLGANVATILLLLLRDFAKLIGVAFIIATPIAYLAMNEWLENFAYRTRISWDLFVAAGMFCLAVAVLTIIWQAGSAALKNPVDSLRTE